ncbi:MAG TPA: cytochrome P450 [Bryobacteraceae bacterium]
MSVPATSTVNRRPPGPRNIIPFQALLQFRRRAPEYLQDIARQYGDVSFFQFGNQNAFLVNDPDVIKDVLVTSQAKFRKSRMLQRAKVLLGEGLLTSEGQFHLRQRRLAQPAFHRDRLRGYGQSMVDYALRTRDKWTAGETIDLAPEMMRLTLAVVAKTLFNADVDHEAADIGESLSAVLEIFNTVLLPFSEYIQKLPLPSIKRFERARDRLDQTIYRIIAERRQSAEDHGDLLSILLMAKDEDGTGGMTDTQVRDEALTIFLAGHETTAVALTWTLYLLSQNPEVEARLHAELDRVLPNGLSPSVDDLPALKFVEQVFAEGLRLYPPAWAIGRMVLEPYTIPGPQPWELEPGAIIIMSPYVTHRDPRYFADPERFDPDRWLPERAEARQKFSFYPFGGGARVCIGERFAWMEGTLLLATIAQKWRLRLDPAQVVEKRALLTLRPKHGMRMRVEARTQGISR